MSFRGSPVTSHTETLGDLVHSTNTFAAGIGEVVQAFISAANAPNTRPIMVEYTNRIMAIGRQRMSTMNGRNALLYMKSKFGLLNATAACFHQATFEGNEEQFVEVDLDSWEELVAYMVRLRIIN
ncbi:hypothetical protein M413DRAFT_446438 [Hebeloma cylindrosporum]|uniref:Uncharacterized protein n=1 Tax=Hebeloma cylindrosporum TaxID=76867 RepID=A0A0C3C7R9_HEBCY|nr:hypothetical protein M413DRAFT_446438 [Hebeloma cylindrosporum h7]